MSMKANECKLLCLLSSLSLLMMISCVYLLSPNPIEVQVSDYPIVTKSNYSPFLNYIPLTPPVPIDLQANTSFPPTTPEPLHLLSWEDSSNDSSPLQSSTLIKHREISNSNISCIPNSYGYTDQQVERLFKPKSFKACESNDIIQKVTNTSIEVVCKNGGGEYMIGGYPEMENFGRVDVKGWNKLNGHATIDTTGNEFVLIKCSFRSTQAYLTNRFLSSASIRAKTLAASLSSSSSSSPPSPPRTLGVYLIMMDSVSRFHFFRHMQSTISYLNSQLTSSSRLVLYDFLVNNAQGENTRPNLVALLLGRSFAAHSKLLEGLSLGDASKASHYREIQEKAMWKHYERHGFVTMFGYDTIWNFFAEDVGRKIYTDHTVLSFWNAAKTAFGYGDFVMKQRCFGDKNAHRYMLDYVNQFRENYGGVNKFVYFHTSLAHEDSGSVYKTFDVDLKEFIEEMLRGYEEREEDFVIMVAGDHGRRVKEWDYTDEGLIENKYPFHMILTTQDLIRRIGKDTHEILMHNSERLVSRYDWYVTLKHLALLPYGNLNTSSRKYREFIEESDSPNAVSLLLEKVPDDRVCEDVNIEEYLCICRDYKPLELYSKIVDNMVEVIEATLQYSNIQVLDGAVCKQLEFAEIVEASEFRLKLDVDGGNRHLKARFRVKRYVDALIEIVIYAADEKEFNRVRKDASFFPSRSGKVINKYGTVTLKMQAESIKRIDLGICAVEIQGKRITHNLCVC